MYTSKETLQIGSIADNEMHPECKESTPSNLHLRDTGSSGWKRKREKERKYQGNK